METNNNAEKIKKDNARLKRLRIIQRVALLLAAATVILGIYYFRTDIYNYYMRSRAMRQAEQNRDETAYSRISFEPDSNNIFALFGSDLAVLNRSTYKLYSADGKELFSFAVSFSMPGICVGSDYVAVYDRKSSEIYIFDKTSLVDTLTLDASIISVSINERGYMVVVREDELYRSVVSVFNSHHDLVYEWKSADYYVINAAISPKNNSMVATAYTQSEGSIISREIFFDLSSEQYLSQCDIVNTMVTNINYVSDDVVIAVGDNKCVAVASNGEIVYTYEYGNDMLKTGAQSSKTVLLSFVDRTSGLGAKIVAFGPESYDFAVAEDEVREISICGNYISVLYAQGIQVFDINLQKLTDEIAVSQIRKAMISGDGLVMFVYTSDAGFVDLITPFRNRGQK